MFYAVTVIKVFKKKIKALAILEINFLVRVRHQNV